MTRRRSKHLLAGAILATLFVAAGVSYAPAAGEHRRSAGAVRAHAPVVSASAETGELEASAGARSRWVDGIGAASDDQNKAPEDEGLAVELATPEPVTKWRSMPRLPSVPLHGAAGPVLVAHATPRAPEARRALPPMSGVSVPVASASFGSSPRASRSARRSQPDEVLVPQLPPETLPPTDLPSTGAPPIPGEPGVPPSNAPVPEPGGLAVLVGAFAMLGRRRRH